MFWLNPTGPHVGLLCSRPVTYSEFSQCGDYTASTVSHTQSTWARQATEASVSLLYVYNMKQQLAAMQALRNAKCDISTVKGHRGIQQMKFWRKNLRKT